MVLGIVVVLFPVKVVQKADDAPKTLVLRIELAGEIAHGLFDRLAVLDMERVLVVGLQQIESRLAGDPGIKGCHCMLLSSLEPMLSQRHDARPCTRNDRRGRTRPNLAGIGCGPFRVSPLQRHARGFEL